MHQASTDSGRHAQDALDDLRKALALLAEHNATQATEDVEDVRLADEAIAEIRAGGATFSHDEMLKRCGLATMKVGIVSDIHGDIVALDAALARLHDLGCDPILCAGYLLDIEPFSEEVVQRIKAEKIVCIRGNHERWALARRRRQLDMRKFAPSIVEMPDLFSDGAELSREALAYLATLPSHWAVELMGVRVAMWHARPGSDMEGIRADTTSPALRRQLLDQAAADVLIVGHAHDAFSLAAGKGRIVNPGACCSKTFAFNSLRTPLALDWRSRRCLKRATRCSFRRPGRRRPCRRMRRCRSSQFPRRIST
jgi:putative phosphoesterase